MAMRTKYVWMGDSVASYASLAAYAHAKGELVIGSYCMPEQAVPVLKAAAHAFHSIAGYGTVQALFGAP